MADIYNKSTVNV